MSSQFLRSAARSARRVIAASRSSPLASEGRSAAVAAMTALRGTVPALSSFCQRADYKDASKSWLYSSVLGLPAAVYMLHDQEAHAAELERTFIAIKPDGVQRGLIAEIISRFERKGYKLVAIKIMVESPAK